MILPSGKDVDAAGDDGQSKELAGGRSGGGIDEGPRPGAGVEAAGGMWRWPGG